MPTPHFPLRLASFPEDAFEVASFRGRESLSKPFSFDLLVLAAPDIDPLDIPLAQPATFEIPVPGRDARVLHGLVAAVSPEAPSAVQGRPALRMRLVPRLALLRHRIQSRIFQDRTVPDIIAAVLDAAHIPSAFRLGRTYPRRPYCVQYRESDLAFLHRLLAEEGIFYFFDPRGGEAVLFGDTPEAYPPIAEGTAGPLDQTGAFTLAALGKATAPRLRLRERAGMSPTEDDVLRFSLRRAIQPGAALLRDRDFRRPTLELRAEAAIEGADPSLRVYDHHPEHEPLEVDPSRASTYLEQHRRAALRGEGETACRRLLPGHRFRLAAEVAPRLTGEYTVTRVEHEGHAPGFSMARGGDGPSYSARFECTPADFAYRPKPARRALRNVIEPATVVGPKGEEIHVDGHGRVKVQFPWDLEGKGDEYASCWIRVIQPWAGAAWGAQFIPRVGMEVMVSFLGGDPDCPVILGAVPNATHPPAYPLPQSATQSGIRTQSTPGGGGFHEIRFEDRRGSEELYVRAQRELREDVLGDRVTEIGGGWRSGVQKDVEERIGGHRRIDVAGHEESSVEGDRRVHTGGACASATKGSRHEHVGGDATTTVDRDHTLHVGGNASVVVGSGGKESFHSLFVYGDHIEGARGMIKLEAAEGIRMTSGDSVVEIGPEGVTIRARRLSFEGAEEATLSGKGPALRLGEDAEIVAKKLRFIASDSWLLLDENASLHGKQVKLNCDDEVFSSTAGDGAPAEKRRLLVKLSDASYQAYAGKRYHLLVDGAAIEGTTDAQGRIDKQIPKDAKSIRVVLWVGEYPTGERRVWELRRTAMPAADTVAGAQMRLSNLGYLGGAPGGQENEAARAAISAFQEDAGIAPTGQLDEATARRLVEVHGS